MGCDFQAHSEIILNVPACTVMDCSVIVHPRRPEITIPSFVAVVIRDVTVHGLTVQINKEISNTDKL